VGYRTICEVLSTLGVDGSLLHLVLFSTVYVTVVGTSATRPIHWADPEKQWKILQLHIGDAADRRNLLKRVIEINFNGLPASAA
jgi:hypothetical protein